jgi:hypothetical protein
MTKTNTQWFLQSPSGAVVRFRQTNDHTIVMRNLETDKVVQAFSVPRARDQWRILTAQGWKRVDSDPKECPSCGTRGQVRNCPECGWV